MYDQIGNGGKGTEELLPVRVSKPEGMGHVLAISAGGSHNLALCEDGSLWAWGLNYSGQVGNGKGIDSKEPLPVRVSKPEGMGDVLAISAGSAYSLALCEDGSLWAWGNNWFGQLGNGKGGEVYSIELLPVRVQLPPAKGNAESEKEAEARREGNKEPQKDNRNGLKSPWEVKVQQSRIRLQ
ncbi:MAG: hypothetical protein U5N86_04440 [Planctomycetota bacterium]|nr:hypothetical protein [Planctomycetota bacterium]